MAHIKINFDGLAQQASTMSNLTQSYEALNTRMNNLTQRISAQWQGEASRAYVEMMQKYCQQAGKMVGILQAFRSYASNASTDFSDVDNTCAGMIRNSF